MTELSVVHATFTIERTFKAPPARVFAAFSKPATKRRWFAEGFGMRVDEFSLDFRVGGRETFLITPEDGSSIANESVYQDIVPGRRIVCAFTMATEGKPFSASLGTFQLEPAGDGTKLIFTEQAAFFEGGDNARQRKGGWAQLFDKLVDVLKKA